MATADFWHEMAGEFERVDPTGRLHLIVSRGMTTKRLQLIANSDFVPILVRDKFHALAARAGAELDSESDSPVQVWLLELERTNQPDVIDPPLELLDPQTKQREHHKIHQLNNLGGLSAALCYRLETKERHVSQTKTENEQRREMVNAHFNIKLQAEIEAERKFLKRKHLRELEAQERPPNETPATGQMRGSEFWENLAKDFRSLNCQGIRLVWSAPPETDALKFEFHRNTDPGGNIQAEHAALRTQFAKAGLKPD